MRQRSLEDLQLFLSISLHYVAYILIQQISRMQQRSLEDLQLSISLHYVAYILIQQI
jgi:hypothetical protein